MLPLFLTKNLEDSSPSCGTTDTPFWTSSSLSWFLTARVNLSLAYLPPANVVCEGYVFTPVCHSVHGGGMRGCSGGACMVARGACMVALGGMHGCSGGRHVWLLPGGGICGFCWGVCMVFSGGVRGFFQGGHA